jgi:hypothetical protein
LIISRSLLLRIRNVSYNICRKNQNTFSPSKIMPFIRECGKYCRTRLATDDSMKRCMRIACWTAKTRHTHTLRICNTYGFSTTKNGYADVPYYYVTPTLHVLCISSAYKKNTAGPKFVVITLQFFFPNATTCSYEISWSPLLAVAEV